MDDRPFSSPPRPAWFAAKSHGYGAGMPVRWQGWLTLAVYALAVGGLLALSGWVRPIGVVAVTLILCVVCWRTTEGGWRWRWGNRR